MTSSPYATYLWGAWTVRAMFLACGLFIGGGSTVACQEARNVGEVVADVLSASDTICLAAQQQFPNAEALSRCHILGTAERVARAILDALRKDTRARLNALASAGVCRPNAAGVALPFEGDAGVP